MRMLVVALLVFGTCGRLLAADDKLDEKFLVGTWSIKMVGGKKPTSSKGTNTIEFKEDGTYIWNTGTKMEGTYKLKGNSLELTEKGAKAPLITMAGLQIKNGKIIHTLSKSVYNELTRMEK